MVRIESDKDVKILLSRLGSVLRELESKGVSADDAIGMVHVPEGVPVSIFNSRLGALESIVKYMREELGLSYGSIAKLLGRNEGPIGVTYRQAVRKYPGRLDIKSGQLISFGAFRANDLSILEAAVLSLQRQGYSIGEIADVMCRDYKTIWTVLDRARRKMAG